MGISSQNRMVKQELAWGGLYQERRSPADTMFTNTGRRIYVLGDIDGQFRPRSNPYDLYSLGRPDPEDPLADKLQGVWAQPVKGMAGYGYSLRFGERECALKDASTFTQAFAYVEFQYECGPLLALRRDFAVQDLPLLFSILTLKNQGIKTLKIEVVFSVQFDLQDAWFTCLAGTRNSGQTLSVEEGRLVARSAALPDRWAAAAGCRLVAEVKISSPISSTGEMITSLKLKPGEQVSLPFALSIESQGGVPAALALLEHGFARQDELLAEKIALYAETNKRGPHLVSPDPELNAAFDLARANMQMLEAESPGIGRYFFAGLEIFPFWFSNDGAYSIPGLMASGFSASALNHVLIGLKNLQGGCVPHQISPSGKVAFAGNAQETPQWVMSIWDAYRWSADREFLARLYPGALRGMFEYVLGAIDPDGDGYASGPGMVEAAGMGEEKLDTAAYTWAGLHALAQMADALGDGGNAARARSKAEAIAARFDEDWWDEPSGAYAMSLQEPGNIRHQVPHWAVVVPLEVGLAPMPHAATTFSTLRRDYLNQWGLKHTVGNDERVWTLPTATLSRAAYRYGELGLGEEMLRRLADTLHHGSIGLFHELIPEGACIIQLWSAATFIRGIVEDMLGISIDAPGHALHISPRIPADWQSLDLNRLSFAGHQVNLHFAADRVSLEHAAGSHPVKIEVLFASGTLATASVRPGESITLVLKQE